jgi:hypothetical protein
MVECIILPTLASCNPAIVRQQEEVAHMLFHLLAAQQRWALVHLLVAKGATALEAGGKGRPPALSHCLADLEAPQHSPSDEGQVCRMQVAGSARNDMGDMKLDESQMGGKTASKALLMHRYIRLG